MNLNYVSKLENHSDKISVIYQTEQNMLKEHDIWWSKRAWSKTAFYLYVFDELWAIFLTIWVADQTHKASGLMIFNQMINTMQQNCPFLSVHQYLLSLIKKKFTSEIPSEEKRILVKFSWLKVQWSSLIPVVRSVVSLDFYILFIFILFI